MRKSLPLIVGLIALAFATLSLLLLSENRQLKDKLTSLSSPTPTPTCRPRPACLDAIPPCKIRETSDMCPQSSIPAGWQIFTDKAYGFEIALPPKWHQIEHSSNFQNFFPFEGPDKSQFQIIVDTTTEKTLSNYLNKLDKTNSTSWEGRPSKKVISTSIVKVGIYQSLERKESWLAAGFTTIATYTKVNDKIFIFNLLPGNKPYDKTDSFAVYPSILSTFKLL